MSRASCTIGLFALTAVLGTGCAVAPPWFGKVQADSRTPADGESAPDRSLEPDLAKTIPADAPSTSLENALETLRITNPVRYVEVVRVLEGADSDLPPHLRQTFQNQVAATLLASEARHVVRETSRDTDIARPAHWPSSSHVAQTPRRLPEASIAGVPETPVPGPALAPSVPPTQEAADVGTANVVQNNVANSTAIGTVQAVSHAASDPNSEKEVVQGSWQDHLHATTETLEKELARFDYDENEATRLNAYLRLLYVIADQRDSAIAPIDGFSDDEREFWKHQLYALLVSLDADDMHASSRRAALALRDLRTAANHLSNISTLDVRNLAFCPRVFSFGRFVEYDNTTFRPGQEVLLYVEVDNFAVEQKGEEYETHLQGEYSIFDAQNARVKNVVLPHDKQLCNNRRRDYFIAYRLHLPDDLPAGSYLLQLTIEDMIGKKSSVATIDFRFR